MRMDCESVRRTLGAWLDGEVGEKDSGEIQGHLEACLSCGAERDRLERLQFLLRTALEEGASKVTFESFWQGIERRISQERARGREIWDWLRPVILPRRLAWAIPLTVICVLAVLFGEQFLSELGWGPRSNVAAVESIDGHGFNLALLRESETKTTVIWLFQDEEEDEPAPEAASTDASL